MGGKDSPHQKLHRKAGWWDGGGEGREPKAAASGHKADASAEGAKNP
jgi:hypothetical protein